MFPWLAHGHIFPYLQLSKHLSSTPHFTTYLCSTAVNLTSITSAAAAAQPHLIELHMPSPPELPPHLHTTKNLPSHLLPTLIKSFQESTSSFSQILQTLNPDLLIFDVFQPWAPKLASSMGIPSVYFSTSGASSISYLHHLHTFGSPAGFPFPALSLPEAEIARMRSPVRPNIKEADEDYPFGNYRVSTDIALVKSSRYVEEKYVNYLSSLCKKEIVCTGALIASDDAEERDDQFKVIEWLDEREVGSTIYISFGSECFLSKEQIGEVAKGLLLCDDVNFLWVVRFPFEERERRVEEELPVGFREAVKGRGLVVEGWAAQARILGHPSVGGFVSHCGRSSITESLYFGVPVVAMAMKVEQPLNAQLVVELGVGVEVGRDGNGEYVGEEIGRAIEKVMVVEKEGLRSRARGLSEVMREKEGEEVSEVARQLLKICVKNKKMVA
ncbi:UDP-glucosyltransferase 29-like [Salvia miltiorrhiza]|uniref:UDP-glucosyltransferase 29-like n=1 Tax=Salvia miltiorrhiza TaxID=226208 RepID=UPI0025AC00B5|nr:UDP-glucosyltransferase 29-like [Salvia miltiorrhiza]